MWRVLVGLATWTATLASAPATDVVKPFKA